MIKPKPVAARSNFNMIARCTFLTLLVVAAGQARAAEPTRAELPIKQVTLPDGAVRFTVPVKVGETTVEAGLDTGSVGLRILPGALKAADAKPTAEPDVTRYGSGAMYQGVAAKATLDIAGLKGESTFQQIEQVGCVPRKPNCPASQIPQSEYGIMGNGIAGAGFKAIIGINPKSNAKTIADNPFRSVGATRFIIDLPRTKEETGRIILNPSAAEVEGFTQLPPYKRIPAQVALGDDAVNGCLTAPSNKKVCGAVTFDSGAGQMRVVSPDPLGEAWPEGTRVSLVLDDGAGHTVLTDNMTLGTKKELTHLAFEQMEFLPKTIIRLGVAPYMTYSVLYDLDHGGLSVKPRPPRS